MSTVEETLRSVALFLGPYRNLTTLTASILHLHPRCQVLNHGGNRILDDETLNFLADPSDATFERFCDFALAASTGGKRGWDGGSVLLSHAFDRPPVRDAYRRRYGDASAKRLVHCLVWKESLLVANELRKRAVDVAALLDRQPRLRFLLPVRSPLDCARSNLRSGHAALLTRSDDVVDVLAAVLHELVWFRSLARHHPDRFFSFFDYEWDETLLPRLAGFLQLDLDEIWARDALASFRVGRTYEHDDGLVDTYLRLVRREFAADGEFAAGLERFTSTSAAVRPS